MTEMKRVIAHSRRYYFDLLWHLVRRDFNLRYKGSILGALWLLVVPLMQLMTLVFVFKRVIPLEIDAYPAFVFTALLPWSWFSSSLTTASGLFLNNRDLVRRPNFPPFFLIIVSTFSNLLLYLAVLPLVFVMLFLYGHHVSWTVMLFPLLILVESTLIFGLGLMIASWNVFYRDVQQITSVLLTLMFWITPVFYRPHAVDQKYQFLFEINPMSVLVKSYRDILFYSRPPDWGPFLYTVVFSLVIAILGYTIYVRQLDDVFDAL
ncbi:ABC transporter permease [bacterium]|nr:ABC transporter permease [bacterium]